MTSVAMKMTTSAAKSVAIMGSHPPAAPILISSAIAQPMVAQQQPLFSTSMEQ